MSSPTTPPAHLLGPLTTGTLPASTKLTATPWASRNAIEYTLRVTKGVHGLSTGSADAPAVAVAWGCAEDVHYLGFQSCEFCLPVRAAADLKFGWFGREGFWRPRCVLPLLVMKGGECLLLAPLGAFHEQVCVAGDGELRWGFSGDLDRADEGFEVSVGVFWGGGPRELLNVWGDEVRRRGGVVAKGRYADVSTGKLSYWTDNGAAYWYRKEERLDVPTTLEKTVSGISAAGVTLGSVELDSWFYRHEVTRKVLEVGYLNVVPPTGMMRWEARGDVLGTGGLSSVRERVGGLPLILHSRHISSKSDYVGEKGLGEWWVDKDRAHPADPALFQKWMQQAADWGATAYEQDWLVEIWQGVRQLREAPGRIAKWQRMLNDAAMERNISLIWCMATPADFAQAASLQQIVAVRTCDDYRYAKDPSDLWRWHLTVSCIARALGLWPFKDVFMSSSNVNGTVDINGDANCELEALLSALSAGPVGLGDRLGRTDRNIVRRTCRSDGVLIKPDLPLTALDRSLHDDKSLLWAETNSGAWKYVVVIHAGTRANADKARSAGGEDPPITETLSIRESSPLVAYNWRAGTAEVATELTATLRTHEWKLWIVCPTTVSSQGSPASALIGDPSVYATMGDRRMRVNQSYSNGTQQLPCLDVLGAPGEQVALRFWTATGGVQDADVTIPTNAWTPIDLESLTKLPR